MYETLQKILTDLENEPKEYWDKCIMEAEKEKQTEEYIKNQFESHLALLSAKEKDSIMKRIINSKHRTYPNLSRLISNYIEKHGVTVKSGKEFTNLDPSDYNNIVYQLGHWKCVFFYGCIPKFARTKDTLFPYGDKVVYKVYSIYSNDEIYVKSYEEAVYTVNEIRRRCNERGLNINPHYIDFVQLDITTDDKELSDIIDNVINNQQFQEKTKKYGY